jgi:hypothetical protein
MELVGSLHCEAAMGSYVEMDHELWAQTHQGVPAYQQLGKKFMQHFMYYHPSRSQKSEWRVAKQLGSSTPLMKIRSNAEKAQEINGRWLTWNQRATVRHGEWHHEDSVKIQFAARDNPGGKELEETMKVSLNDDASINDQIKLVKEESMRAVEKQNLELEKQARIHEAEDAYAVQLKQVEEESLREVLTQQRHTSIQQKHDERAKIVASQEEDRKMNAKKKREALTLQIKQKAEALVDVIETQLDEELPPGMVVTGQGE